ncbi:glycogen debranching N-terminal domain-containing protein [Microbacterium sp. 18062]|uniref:glycogen debranching N-terminal domain-containing protein n=1 Tax=Microbacterium sp. 18062 TaxID=2681410 RepID=UPI001359ABAB|nr:glycogen debranching N-terminal domain-containing protein [Microbacterium sp. 18062]
MTPHTPPARQPLLNDAVIALHAPTQVWSGRAGDIGEAAIDGVYHGDTRHVGALTLQCGGSEVEWISVSSDEASRVTFGGLLRGLDTHGPDPRVRLVRERIVGDGIVRERWTLISRVDHEIDTTLSLSVVPEFASLHDVKAGTARARPFTLRVSGEQATAASGPRALVLTAPGGAVDALGPDGASGDAASGAESSSGRDVVRAVWTLHVPPHGRAQVEWTLELADETLVVTGARQAAPWDRSATARRGASVAPALGRWLDRALGDLDALRLALPQQPADEFYAAGAPWFFTLFGRDSLWAARLALPLDAGLAASTLRVLARLQGTVDDDATAQQPGKILHELRASALQLPSEGVTLPPLYFGSVDSTALWVCLLVDAWRGGMPEPEVRALVPALRKALSWLVEEGDADGDGFIDYIDRTGTGLANQGWKDSGDSVQWRDGTLATGPIALCEVQGYAYEATTGAADLLEHLGDADAPSRLRSWARALRTRFADAYWIETPEGRYPAIALDRDKRPVDTLTSNIGHLIGTGILDADDESRIAELLLGPSMSSGYGIRTMSTDAAGYWPLAYHGGSVWAHDTAIVARGMARAGLGEQATRVAEGLLAAAEGFGGRMPELHSGDPRSETATPVPYPAACRPQAWSAAAAITCLTVLERE